MFLQSNGPIPSFYSLSLQSLDGLEDMDHVETTATIEQSVLTLEVVSGLPFRRLWNCTVLAYGCQESNISNDELSEFLQYKNWICMHIMIRFSGYIIL